MATLEYERWAWGQGYRRVAGVDEAGRGPLAGPVVAAAVILDPEHAEELARGALAGLTDSKCLTVRQRKSFYRALLESSFVEIGLGRAEVEEIDKFNIWKATQLAMQRALAALSSAPDLVLVDGLPISGLPYRQKAITKGDAKVLSIAAASVIAKVTRDSIMEELDEKFPGYGFARHKGYSTREHLAALAALGPSPCHRRYFAPVAQLQWKFQCS